jgi:hypothetical protein
MSLGGSRACDAPFFQRVDRIPAGRTEDEYLKWQGRQYDDPQL